MGLLHEIQESLIDDKQGLAPILLKLQLLAGRLGSAPLEEWVKHESDGYPDEVELPKYRNIHASYTGTFSTGYGNANNVKIPRFIIQKYASKWLTREMRESIAAIEHLLDNNVQGRNLTVPTGDLVALLGNRIYENQTCIDVVATISPSNVAAVCHNVRSRMLALTIELERSEPGATDAGSASGETNVTPDTERVATIYNQIIGGDFNDYSVGSGVQINTEIKKGDEKALFQYLLDAGIAGPDAKELADIVASEKPESDDQPLGVRAREWIGKAGADTWNITRDVAKKVITEAALIYYGLK